MSSSPPSAPAPSSPEPGPPPGRRPFLGRLSLPEWTFVSDALRTETVGGVLLLAAAAVALLWANLAPGSYATASSWTVGPSSPLHLDLSIEAWATDGLLTVFFFVAGIELRRELTAGDLRDPRAAALPVVAALCGMAVPALVYLAVNVLPGGEPIGWAVPTATDIAFALGVLAVVGKRLPSALRAFLLTLAVVDDLGAILVIALVYTSVITVWALLASAAGLLLFWFLLRRRVRGWYVYVPLAVATWALLHESGVHATVAGVAMGLMLRCTREPGEAESPGERVEHLVRPLSAGVAVPVFALFAAGVPVSGAALARVFTEPVPVGVVLGLVLGKSLGVYGGTRLAARFTRAALDPSLRWGDVLAVAVLSGIGFTVALLVAELAFAGDEHLTETAKAAVLTGTLLCSLAASVLLQRRNRHHRTLYEEEHRDDDADGIPDVYQQGRPGTSSPADPA